MKLLLKTIVLHVKSTLSVLNVIDSGIRVVLFRQKKSHA